MADSIAFRGKRFSSRLRSYRRRDRAALFDFVGIPTTFLQLFGADLKHLWSDNYDDGTGTFPDSIGGADVDNESATIPTKQTVNGHDYPSFDGSFNSLRGPDISTLDGKKVRSSLPLSWS